MVVGAVVGTFFTFLLGVLNPLVANKAGPDWLWSGGRTDPIRCLYFRPDGSFRRYGRIGFFATLAAGAAALAWILPQL